MATCIGFVHPAQCSSSISYTRRKKGSQMKFAQTIYCQCAQGPNQSRHWCHTWWVPALSNYANNLHNYHDNTMSIIYCQNKAFNLMVMEKTKIKQMASTWLTNCINFVHPAHVNLMLYTRKEVKWHRTQGPRTKPKQMLMSHLVSPCVVKLYKQFTWLLWYHNAEGVFSKTRQSIT